MAINPLNNISRVYLEQVVESSHLETDMKKRQSENEKAREDMKKTAAYKSMAATAAKKMEEGLDPVGEEDADIDNDRRKNTKSDRYLLRRRRAVGKAISTQEAKEVKKWWDDDGDGIGYEAGEVSSKFKKNKKKLKEGLSNWRQDLSEVMDDVVANKEVKEKKVNNKIKTSAMGGGIKLGESIENLGGELVEMVEIDGVLDEITDIELTLLSDDLIEEVVEEFFYECLEEGYEVDEIEDMLIESIETSAAILNESADDTKIEKRNDKLEKVKSAVKKVARGVGYAAGAVVRGAKAIGREVKAGYAAGKESDSGSSSGTRKPQTYRNTHQQSKKPGLLSRLGSKLKSGLKKAVASGARAVSRGARNVARKMEDGGSSSTPKSTPAATKKPAEKSADPWEGSETTPTKPKAKTAAKPKAKKKTGKLDSLLADIRNEEMNQLDELSVGKMLAYVKKGEKNRADLNKKWDKGTATHRERMRVLGREEGEARAYKKIEKKTGKLPYEMNALDRAKYAVTKEEVELDEAEGSYGQTPKADAAYTALATGKGKSKTKSLALKHAIRSAADRYNSDKPYSHRSKMTQSDRDYHRGQSENHGKDREGIDFDEFDTGASGPGGKPKGKKLERQRKTGVSAESFNIDERALDATETKEKERIVKGMKKNLAGFRARYGDRAKEVMYATATKNAKDAMDTSKSDRRYGVEEAMMPDSEVEDQNKNNVTSIADKQKLANLKTMEQKQRQLRLQRFNLQKQGKLPLDTN